MRTERDKQISIGASNASNPCTRCLVDDLTLDEYVDRDEDSDYNQSFAWAGAAIGTAIHERLETLVRQHRPTWLPEQRVQVGSLRGYGVVKSTTDVYIPEDKRTHDWKTTTKKKLPYLIDAWYNEPTEYDVTALKEARFKVNAYRSQLHLYGKGVIESLGLPVEVVSISFICRDAVGDKDFKDVEMVYDPDYAQAVWTRLERIWDAVQSGREPETFVSHPSCWFCNNVR